MGQWSLIFALAVCSACTFRMPATGELSVRVSASVKVAPKPPPPPPPPPIAIEGAAVVEFFGVPLEGADDVVFVLDCSGSMSEWAQGRIAQITTVVPAAVEPAEPPSEWAAPQAPTVGVPPEPPASEPPSAPAPSEPPAYAPPPSQPPATRPTKISVARAELIDALSRLPAGTRLNVLFFNGGLEAYAEGLFALDESRRADLVAFIGETIPTGPTALGPAMRTAFLMNPRRIVLLSDGLGNIGGNSDSVLRDAFEGIRGGVRIDAIGLGVDQDRRLLGSLALHSGGIYQDL